MLGQGPPDDIFIEEIPIYALVDVPFQNHTRILMDVERGWTSSMLEDIFGFSSLHGQQTVLCLKYGLPRIQWNKKMQCVVLHHFGTSLATH